MKVNGDEVIYILCYILTKHFQGKTIKNSVLENFGLKASLASDIFSDIFAHSSLRYYTVVGNIAVLAPIFWIAG
jgi:hypothetical protein